jgi:uncharacterized protein (TIGR02145 family)
MKKVFYLALTLIVLGAASMNAQVTIGSLDDPNDFSVLELISSNGTSGLRLPQLTNGQKATLTTQLQGLSGATKEQSKGLTIFNTDSNCTDVWNGTAWISTCGGPIISAVINGPLLGRISYPMFTYQTLQLTADGYGGSPADTYRWYVDNQYIANASAKTFTFNNTHVINYAGNHEIFCLVSNALGVPVKSNIITAIVQQADFGTLTGVKFKDKDNVEHTVAMQYLGQENTTDGGYPGDLYQFGRIADDHEKINSPVVNLQATGIDAQNNKYFASNGTELTGKFITVNPWSPDELNRLVWTPDNKNPNPCPNGWHIPTFDEMQALFPTSIYGGTGGYSSVHFNHATLCFNWCNESNQCMVVPLTTMRIGTGVVTNMNSVGSGGEYFARAWVRGDGPQYFYFWLNYDNAYRALHISAEANRGYSVRCFKD